MSYVVQGRPWQVTWTSQRGTHVRYLDTWVAAKQFACSLGPGVLLVRVARVRPAGVPHSDGPA